MVIPLKGFSWVETDPLFVVGNGSGVANDPNQYRDALVVYKNGNIRMQKAQGDISMGAFQQDSWRVSKTHPFAEGASLRHRETAP